VGSTINASRTNAIHPELGEFTMPKVYGTDEQKQQLTDLINRYKLIVSFIEAGFL
jgi:hypothetical protein